MRGIIINYKLLVTDLDDTLLADGGRMTEGNLRAIRRAEAAGVRTVICSGRSHMSLKYFEDMFRLMAEGNYSIGFNGGVVYETASRKIVYEVRMKNDLAKYIIGELRNLTTDLMVYADGQLIVERETENITRYADHVKLKLTQEDSFDNINSDVSKILIKSPRETLDTIAAAMEPLIADKCLMFYSSDTLLEFSDMNAHKGRAVDFLREYLGHDRKQVIAVGDNMNDITMLEAAGLPVAVRNAVPALKKASRYVTAATNNEDAIEEIVNTFILSI